MEIGTYQNKDDLNGAIDGLAKFCHSFCINCEETEKQNDLVFRCKECPFEREDKKCSVKVFLHKYATEEQIEMLECGENPFLDEMEKELEQEHGYVEYDYAVVDVDTDEEMVSWD